VEQPVPTAAPAPAVDPTALARLVDERVSAALAEAGRKPLPEASRHPSGLPCATCGISNSRRWYPGPVWHGHNSPECQDCAAARDRGPDPDGQMDVLAYRLGLVELHDWSPLLLGVAQYLITKGIDFRRAMDAPGYGRLAEGERREPWNHVRTRLGLLIVAAQRYVRSQGDPLGGQVFMTRREPSPLETELGQAAAEEFIGATAEAWRLASASGFRLPKLAGEPGRTAAQRHEFALRQADALRQLDPEQRTRLRQALRGDEVRTVLGPAGAKTLRTPGHSAQAIAEVFGPPVRV
jgi:hypothetical protein